jgi:hypothetical protein
MTLSYKAKQQETPVADQITKNSETSDACQSRMDILVTPNGTKYVELLTSDAFGHFDSISGSTSIPINIALLIDGFKSFESGQNNTFSWARVNVRASEGGLLEDSIMLFRDHTGVFC